MTGDTGTREAAVDALYEAIKPLYSTPATARAGAKRWLNMLNANPEAAAAVRNYLLTLRTTQLSTEEALAPSTSPERVCPDCGAENPPDFSKCVPSTSLDLRDALERIADIAVMALGEVTTGGAYGLYHKSFREHFVARLARADQYRAIR